MYLQNSNKIFIYYNFKIKQDITSRKKNISWALCNSPIGELFIMLNKDKIIKIELISKKEFQKNKISFFRENYEENNNKIEKIRDIIFYKNNDLKIELKGTAFQLKVWENILKTKFGEILSYSEVSERINKKSSHRAVANALKANEIAFLIPCHRIIKKSGDIGGFKWGRERKKEILEYERCLVKSHKKND